MCSRITLEAAALAQPRSLEEEHHHRASCGKMICVKDMDSIRGSKGSYLLLLPEQVNILTLQPIGHSLVHIIPALVAGIGQIHQDLVA